MAGALLGHATRRKSRTVKRDVIAVQCLEGFRLLLTFEGDERRELDMAEFQPFDGVFEPLKNAEFFQRVRVAPELGTIVWPNGADLCPDVVYERSKAID